MAKKTTVPMSYKRAFWRRLQSARIASGYTQETLSARLGIDRDTYAKWESRSLVPHHYIWPICDIVNSSPEFLLAGVSNIASGRPDELLDALT